MLGEEEFQNEPFGCCGVSGGIANTQSTLITSNHSIMSGGTLIKSDKSTIMSGGSRTDFQNGPCGCCSKPGGAANCLMTCFCPCYSVYKSAENIGDDFGVHYCIGTLCGCGCCVLIDLGMKVAKKQSVEMSWYKSCMCSCLNPCTCYSCAVSNEALLCKAANSPVEPVAKKMDRCMDMMRMQMYIDSEQRKEEAQLRKEAAQQREVERRAATEERKEEREQYGEERRALAQQRHDDRIERIEREEARDRRREDDRVRLEKERQEERRDIRRQQETHEVHREDDHQLFIQSLSVIGKAYIETCRSPPSPPPPPPPPPPEKVLRRSKSSDKVLKRSTSSMIN